MFLFLVLAISLTSLITCFTWLLFAMRINGSSNWKLPAKWALISCLVFVVTLLIAGAL